MPTHALPPTLPPAPVSQPADGHAAVVARVCRYIEAADQPPTLAELAQHAQLSPHHLHRVFKQATGLTPKAYALAHRSRRVREALSGNNSTSVTARVTSVSSSSFGLRWRSK